MVSAPTHHCRRDVCLAGHCKAVKDFNDLESATVIAEEKVKQVLPQHMHHLLVKVGQQLGGESDDGTEQ